jgi:hypothetical protein
MIIGTISAIDKEVPFFIGGSGKAYLRIKMVEVLCDDRMDIINHGFEIGQKVVIINDEKCARRIMRSRQSRHTTAPAQKPVKHGRKRTGLRA